MSIPFPDPQRNSSPKAGVRRQRRQAFWDGEWESFLSLALEGERKQGPPQQSGNTHRDTTMLRQESAEVAPLHTHTPPIETFACI